MKQRGCEDCRAERERQGVYTARCRACKNKRNMAARLGARDRKEAYESAGMVRVRGNMGGTYYE